MSAQLRTQNLDGTQDAPAPGLDTRELLTLLTQQRDLYRRLRELAERQRALICGERPELLLNILSERQGLVASLTRLNEQLAPYRRRWDELYAGFAEPIRLQAATLLAEINETLRVIIATDQEDTALLSARKEAVGRELGTLAGGQSANAAYARQSHPSVAGGADLTV